MQALAVMLALIVALRVVLAVQRRWGKWPRHARNSYSYLGRVKVIPTRPDRRTLGDR